MSAYDKKPLDQEKVEQLLDEAYKGFTAEERAGTAYTCGKPEYVMYRDGDYCPLETGEVESYKDCYYGVEKTKEEAGE